MTPHTLETGPRHLAGVARQPVRRLRRPRRRPRWRRRSAVVAAASRGGGMGGSPSFSQPRPADERVPPAGRRGYGNRPSTGTVLPPPATSPQSGTSLTGERRTAEPAAEPSNAGAAAAGAATPTATRAEPSQRGRPPAAGRRATANRQPAAERSNAGAAAAGAGAANRNQQPNHSNAGAAAAGAGYANRNQQPNISNAGAAAAAPATRTGISSRTSPTRAPRPRARATPTATSSRTISNAGAAAAARATPIATSTELSQCRGRGRRARAMPTATSTTSITPAWSTATGTATTPPPGAAAGLRPGRRERGRGLGRRLADVFLWLFGLQQPLRRHGRGAGRRGAARQQRTQQAAAPAYNYSQPISTTAAPPEPAVADQAASAFDQARQAFKAGDYAQALQLVQQAAGADAQRHDLHEFLALILFAQGQYEQAAAPLYAVLSVGPGWDWTTLSGMYPDVATYTRQLRNLEAYINANPKSAQARFVLAYQYLCEGHDDNAIAQLKQVVKLQPGDTLSAQLIARSATRRRHPAASLRFGPCRHLGRRREAGRKVGGHAGPGRENRPGDHGRRPLHLVHLGPRQAADVHRRHVDLRRRRLDPQRPGGAERSPGRQRRLAGCRSLQLPRRGSHGERPGVEFRPLRAYLRRAGFSLPSRPIPQIGRLKPALPG